MEIAQISPSHLRELSRYCPLKRTFTGSDIISEVLWAARSLNRLMAKDHDQRCQVQTGAASTSSGERSAWEHGGTNWRRTAIVGLGSCASMSAKWAAMATGHAAWRSGFSNGPGSQATAMAGLSLRRERIAWPMPPRPRINIAQVDGSGTAAIPVKRSVSSS